MPAGLSQIPIVRVRFWQRPFPNFGSRWQACKDTAALAASTVRWAPGLRAQSPDPVYFGGPESVPAAAASARHGFTSGPPWRRRATRTAAVTCPGGPGPCRSPGRRSSPSAAAPRAPSGRAACVSTRPPGARRSTDRAFFLRPKAASDAPCREAVENLKFESLYVCKKLVHLSASGFVRFPARSCPRSPRLPPSPRTPPPGAPASALPRAA